MKIITKSGDILDYEDDLKFFTWMSEDEVSAAPISNALPEGTIDLDWLESLSS